jgi:hypothetical protein
MSEMGGKAEAKAEVFASSNLSGGRVAHDESDCSILPHVSSPCVGGGVLNVLKTHARTPAHTHTHTHQWSIDGEMKRKCNNIQTPHAHFLQKGRVTHALISEFHFPNIARLVFLNASPSCSLLLSHRPPSVTPPQGRPQISLSLYHCPHPQMPPWTEQHSQRPHHVLLKLTEGSRGAAMREAEIYHAHTPDASHPASECKQACQKGREDEAECWRPRVSGGGRGGGGSWREAACCMQKYAADR